MSRITWISITLVLLLLTFFTWSMSVGNFLLSFGRVWEIIAGAIGLGSDSGSTEIERHIVLGIRFPRALFAVLIGAALAVSGAALQGIFRNPLVDSGLIGISTGASLFASLFILFNSALPWLQFFGEGLALSLVAFVGAMTVAFLVYRLSLTNGELNSLTLILSGIALNALAGAGTGLLTYLANDDQLRDLTFWTLGSLGSATGEKVVLLALFVIPAMLVLLFLSKSLNVLALGESTAQYMGFRVKRIKLTVIIASTAMVGAAVSVSGVIGFVGLVVPHIIRTVIGPDHRQLLPLSALFGAILLLLADMIARTLIPPTEIPVGIITALMGTPVFLAIIFRYKRKFSV